MKWLAAGVAALALMAGPVAAQGNGNGNGKGQGNAPAKAERGNGGGGGQDRGNSGKSDRASEPGPAMKQDRGNQRAERRDDDRGNGNRAVPAGRAETGKANGRNEGNGNWKADRGNDRAVTYDRNDHRRVRDDTDRDYVEYRRTSYGVIDGCPPGLAKKNNGCQPPGQAKRDASYRGDWWGYDNYRDDRFYYRDGYLLRFGDRGNVLSYLPLLGGALGIGNAWPSYYEPVSMPRYYNDFYALGDPRGYRYADNVIYRVDPETAAITSIAALLTGDDFAIGSPVPSGYDVYNVPYEYRDRYYDSPQAMYRYSDGYVYQVDPETRLVAAAIELIAS